MYGYGFFYDGITDEKIERFIKKSDRIKYLIENAKTDEEKESAEDRRKSFYSDIESVEIGEVEAAIKAAEETGDNEKKTLLERIKAEIRIARKEMYARIAPEIINKTIGLGNGDSFRYNYWDDAEVEDLAILEQEIGQVEINRDNFQRIMLGTNINSIRHAIERAEEAGDNEKKEKLLEIAGKIQDLAGSASIYSLRYQPAEGHTIEKVPDESILKTIDRMFEELDLEASAGFVLNKAVYIYLTNAANDKNEFAKRAREIRFKLQEYEKTKSPESLKNVRQTRAIAREDIKNDNIRGLDENVK